MGEEIPFDVAAESGDDSAFYSYVPMTGRYVAEHGDELRALPSFAPAREATVEAGVAASYLEARGEQRARRSRCPRRADADHLLLRALGGLCRVHPRPRAPGDGAGDPRRRKPRRRRGGDAAGAGRRPADADAAPATAARHAHRPRRLDRGAGRRDAQRGHGPRGLGAAVPGGRRAGLRGRGRGRAAATSRADQRDEALQGRRHRPRPLRLRPDRRGMLAPDRHRRAGDPPGRLPPERGGGRGTDRVRDHAGGAARPRHGPDLGGRPLRDGLRARHRAGGIERPPAGDARRARGPRARRARRCRCARRR